MKLEHLRNLLSLCVGLFVFYTAATGPFEGLIQRAGFVALVVCLGLCSYPLGEGKRWRSTGIAIDITLALVTVLACAYVIYHYDRIMTTLPYASQTETWLTIGLLVSVLELGRRAIGIVFPLLVLSGIGYALFGNYLPGALHHRGFDGAFVTETIFLGDLGIWGMLTGISSTIIAAFVLFGALLLHSGGGQAFMDLSMRLGGRQRGGAAKIATISSALFGMISGSAVANVATTGNFTIPMMKRLGYRAPFAAAVEAVASTGGQITPPIMGAAAFVMAEILGIPYLTVIKAAILPAAMFYISVFVTVHMVAVQSKLALVPENELPAWKSILCIHRVVPISCALGGLGLGIYLGRSIATAAFYGIVGLLVSFVLTSINQISLKDMSTRIVKGFIDAGRGMVIIGVLLAGAQVLVAMINLTGVGVSLSSMIVSYAGETTILVAVIVGLVCMIMGMGLPTTAAYVLVAAVLAPAMTRVGVEPLVAHLFVFYFATISVITPPVCVAVFVASGIANTRWLPSAFEAVRLAAVTYLVPFMLLLYPGLTGRGGTLAIVDACASGLLVILSVAGVLTAYRLIGNRIVSGALQLLALVLAFWPDPTLLPFAAIILLSPFALEKLSEARA